MIYFYSKIAFGILLLLGLSYGAAYSIKLYKKSKQHLYRNELIKENFKHVKEDCAYTFDRKCTS